MKNINNIQLKKIAGFIVVNSNLNKESKTQLLNFIQHEASREQIISLLLDGEIVKIDENKKGDIEKRFQDSPFYKIINESILVSIATSYAISGLFRLTDVIVKWVAARKRTCDARFTVGSFDNRICKLEVENDGHQKEIVALKQTMAKEAPTKKNPEKFIRRIKKYIIKLEKKIEDNLIKIEEIEETKKEAEASKQD